MPPSCFREFFFQSRFDDRRHHRRNIAVILRELFYRTGFDDDVTLLRRYKQRFDVGVQHVIHQRQIEFVCEIVRIADAAQQYVCAGFFRILRDELAAHVERYVRIRFDDFLHHAVALLFRKEVLLVRVYRDGDVDRIEEFTRSLDNAQMPVRRRVERPRKYCCCHELIVTRRRELYKRFSGTDAPQPFYVQTGILEKKHQS